MKALPWDAPSRRLGAPRNWDHSESGICHTLEILDVSDPGNGSNWMVSAWQPSEAELEELRSGKPLLLWIRGTAHPVVGLTVGK